MVLSPLLHGEINFINLEEETAKPSLCHSYRSPFKRQVIALPSHGQNTAAVKRIVTGQAGPLIFSLQEAMFLVNRRGFNSVCRVPSLPFSFSLGARQCRVNGVLVGWSSGCLVCCSLPSLFGAVKVRW